jgi:serine/threonine protein kinase
MADTPDTNSVPIPVTKDIVHRLGVEARKHVQLLIENTRIFDKDVENSFPRLRSTEIRFGPVLGRGGYCVVSEIASIEVKNPMENPLDDEEELQRRALAERCIRNGDARYAIKTLGDHTRSDAINYMKGVMDLAIEAKFLAVVRHSNIIRMRAVADCSPYDDGYFLVLDRLYGTLDDRLSQWEKEEAKAKGLVSKMSGKSKKKIKESITKRMVAAYDISRAMMHFHKNNIIYRDLKPENIGFDIRNDVKIFDLGLAKEIHEEERLPDGTYNLTGLTGSLRYMVSTFPP